MRHSCGQIATLGLAAFAYTAAAKPTPFLPTKAIRSAQSGNTTVGKIFHIPILDSHDDYADYQWYSTFDIGTPPQKFTMIIDTGSPEIFLPSIKCITNTCRDDALFDYSKSSTFKKGNGKIEKEGYATGVKADPLPEVVFANGTFDSDTVALGEARVNSTELFLVDTMPAGLQELPIDGVFGFAPTPSGPDAGWFWNLAAAGVLAQPIFSLALNSIARDGAVSTGLLTLGGTEPSRYRGLIEYLPLLLTDGAWSTRTGSYSIDGKNEQVPLGSSFTILDTGTAYIQVADDKTAAAMYSLISPEIKPVGDLGAWGAPCEIMEKLEPEISFSLGTDNNTLNLTIAKSSFNLGPFPDQKDVCQGVLLGPGKSGLGDSWIIGSPLLKNYYTVWDIGNYRFGVAELK